MVIKRSPGGPRRWRAVNFEIHLWSSGMNADCVWRSICIQHVQIEAGLNSDPGNDSFWDKSVTLSMFIDLLTTCRSTQVKMASTDLWPQGMFTFSEMLALVESESSFGAYVCHRRPGGSLATSDLVVAANVYIVSPRCAAQEDQEAWKTKLSRCALGCRPSALQGKGKICFFREFFCPTTFETCTIVSLFCIRIQLPQWTPWEKLDYTCPHIWQRLTCTGGLTSLEQVRSNWSSTMCDLVLCVAILRTSTDALMSAPRDI